MMDVSSPAGAALTPAVPSVKTVLLKNRFPKQSRPSFKLVISPELKELSDWITEIQKLGKEEFGYDQIWIAGGSSRTVLDHVYFGKPLKMRDLDLFFVAGKKESEATAWKLASRIAEKGIARFERKVIRAKGRVNPHLPESERLQYQAGFGIHFLHDRFPILSLSLFHEKSDLELNGIMNVDKIMIPLTSDESLVDYTTKKLFPNSYRTLAQQEILYDKFEGYQAWLDKKPQILNWLSLSVEPPMKSIRILRSFAKCGYSELPASVQDRMKGLVEKASPPKDSFEMMRSFLKILSDKLVAPQLSMLASIGTLKHLSPELQKELEGLNASQIQARLEKGKTKPVAGPLQNLESLTVGMPAKARAKLLLQAYEAYPTTFA